MKKDTVGGLIVIVALLLIAAVIVGVCYSQGVFDSLLPDDMGTQTPDDGNQTPDGGTEQPQEAAGTVISDIIYQSYIGAE